MQEQSGEHTGWNAYFTYQHPPPLTTQHEDMAAFFMHPGECHTELDSVSQRSLSAIQYGNYQRSMHKHIYHEYPSRP